MRICSSASAWTRFSKRISARGGGRFRGVRGRSVWDADPSIKGSSRDFPPELLLDAKFREGVSRLAKYGFSFDAWLFHPQIPELADLAAKFPDTTVILDHVGAPLAVGRHAGKRDEVFTLWRRNLGELAQRPNVFVKLGGLAMHLFGFDLDRDHREAPATFGDAGGGLAALHAHLHRALWRGSLHVREQLPGRQTRRELSGAVERVQEDCDGRLRQREGGAVQGHSLPRLPAEGSTLMPTGPSCQEALLGDAGFRQLIARQFLNRPAVAEDRARGGKGSRAPRIPRRR